MTIASGNEKFGRELADALGLPKYTKWFELRVGVDEAVTIECAFYPELPDGHRGELLKTVRQYEFWLRETSALGDQAKTYDIAGEPPKRPQD